MSFRANIHTLNIMYLEHPYKAVFALITGECLPFATRPQSSEGPRETRAGGNLNYYRFTKFLRDTCKSIVTTYTKLIVREPNLSINPSQTYKAFMFRVKYLRSLLPSHLTWRKLMLYPEIGPQTTYYSNRNNAPTNFSSVLRLKIEIFRDVRFF